MKKRCMVALLVLTAASAMPLAAKEKDQDKQASAEKSDAKKSDRDKVICRTENVTGSLTRKRRTCMTREQWNQQAAATKKGLDDMSRNAGGGANSSWDPANAPGVGGT